MDLLKREKAPILPEAWKLIDDEASRVLKLHLAGRKVVDFDGPHGWKKAAVNTGRLDLLGTEPVAGVSVGRRRVVPLIEVRTPIRLDLMDLDTVARGATDPDLEQVVAAAERVARVEDLAIFHGYDAAGIQGIVPASPHAPIAVPSAQAWPQAVAAAKEVLRQAGVDGPYALVASPKGYDELATSIDDGYPIRKRIVPSIIDELIWAPAIEHAVLLSTRGGDFELTVGQDLSIGYAYREKHEVELYLTESFTFRVLEPAAAIALKRG
jgi:uncharacterized linocin/CFP29 family protein